MAWMLPDSSVTGCSPVFRSITASRRIPRPIPGATWIPSPSGPRWRMASHMSWRSSGVGVEPLVATPAMPHIVAALSGQPALAELHPDLVAHEAQRRLQHSKALERGAWLAQGAEQTRGRPGAVQVQVNAEPHA